MTATDPDGRPLVYWADNLPGGASFDPATHTLLWEPAYGQAGTYNDVTFYVSDGVSTVSSSISLLIAPSPPPPQLAAVPDQTVREGDHLRFTLQGSDADGGPVTYSSAALPGERHARPQHRRLRLADRLRPGRHVDRAVHRHQRPRRLDHETATYTILPAPAAPIFSPLQSWQVSEGQPISFTAFAVDPHNPTFVLPTRLPDGTLSPYPTTQPTVTYTRQRPAARSDVRPGHRAL